jgi:protein required for attachment to host cells
MRKVWIVVANQTDAKIFRAENVNKLEEIFHMTHNEGHKTAHELQSDREGATQGWFSSDTMSPRTPIKVKEAMHFATEIAHCLKKSIEEEQIERFYILAPPAFLGHLRAAMPEAVKNRVFAEIAKEGLWLDEKEIRSYLPPVL